MRYLRKILLLVSILSPIGLVQTLYCDTSIVNCGNWLGIGYETLGGGKCGGQVSQIPGPSNIQGSGYAKFWCGSYFVGVVQKSWNDLKPVWRFTAGEEKACTSDPSVVFSCPNRMLARQDDCDCVTATYACTEYNTGLVFLVLSF